jgi:osmotically-inducible protein OsmY
MTPSTIIDTPTDEQIQRDVFAELKWDARVLPNEIGVAVKNGIVTLTGWVDTYSKRWAAENAAHRVRGVVAVVNDIEVKLSSPAERTDPDIAEAAIHALRWDAFIPIEKIKVTVSKGWISLEGEVEWQYQKGGCRASRTPADGCQGSEQLDRRETPCDGVRSQTED